MRLALEAALAQRRIVDAPDRSAVQPALETSAVPDALAAYVVEAARASDYDHLLLTDGGTHE